MAKRITWADKALVGGYSRATVGWSLIMLVSAVLALASYIVLRNHSADANLRLSLLAEAQQQRAETQQLAQSAVAAFGGEEGAFVALRESRERMQQGIGALDAGTPAALKPQLEVADRAWQTVSGLADTVLAAQAETLGARQAIRGIVAALTEAETAMSRTAGQFATEGVPAEQALEAGRQLARLAAIKGHLERVQGAGHLTAASEAVNALGAEFALRQRTLIEQAGARGRADARAALEDAARRISAPRGEADALLSVAPAVLAADAALASLPTAAKALDAALGNLAADLHETEPAHLGPLPLGDWSIPLFTVIALLGLGGLGARVVGEARQREADSRAQTVRDEQAILRLLDEMGDLADGDLTVMATVTEEKTGAIADSINYAVEALRGLVTTINTTAEQVAQSSQESRSISVRLADSATAQSDQVGLASGAIQSLTEQIDEVARNAGASAEVASRAVEVAGRGGNTVRDTIRGMDSIREQIQETSKRIKRLGESSQEIGEIVELIDDIANQTNILALNAAMQAAMAGDAGRGFAVVADEVQRLAERSRNATKQIEVLVRTIQADTNEAVRSMEASTAGVVAGADLAENAGAALHEIENVSTYIADLTKRIADSAQRQSRQSAEINATVQGIRGITEENTEDAQRAAQAVDTLVSLAAELQRSVAGFRLP